MTRNPIDAAIFAEPAFTDPEKRSIESDLAGRFDVDKLVQSGIREARVMARLKARNQEGGE